MSQIQLANPLREIELLLEALAPNEPSYARRGEISGFIDRVLRQGGKMGDGYQLFGSGSFTSRTYLPASDIDLVLVTRDGGEGNNKEMENIMSVFEALCTEVSLRDSGKSVLSSIQNPMTIRNVEFINARTKLCHCLVNNVGIDVTINSTGALTTVLFIEECDRFLGRDHIFKKSLMLIKAWALNESPSYVGQSLLGSKTGMLSSYALCVLVLCLFNQYSHLTHPLSVLLAFYDTYADVDWGNVVVTIHGIIPVTPTLRATGNIPLPPSSSSSSNESSPLAPFLHTFSSTVESLRASTTTTSGLGSSNSSTSSLQETPARRGSGGAGKMGRGGFSLRSCNIQDPVDANNNLGHSVTRHNLELLSEAFKAGRDHFEHMLRVHYVNSGPQATLKDFVLRVAEDARLADSAPQKPLLRDLPFVRHVFPSSYREYILSLGTRGDLLDHPMQTWKNGEEIAPPPDAPEASFLERLHSSSMLSCQQKLQKCGGNDLLNGELKDMWHALKMALSRDGDGGSSTTDGGGRRTPVPPPAQNVSATAKVPAPAEMAMKTPSRPTTGRDNESSHSPPTPSLSLSSSSFPHQSNSLIVDSDNEEDVEVNVHANRATSPSQDSITEGSASVSVSASASASGGSSPPSPTCASSPEQGPSGKISNKDLKPAVHSAPEWSVEPELFVPTAPGSGNGGGKKTKKKKRKGSTSSLSSPSPVTVPTSAITSTTERSGSRDALTLPSSGNETGTRDRSVDPATRAAVGNSSAMTVTWRYALGLGAAVAVVIALSISTGGAASLFAGTKKTDRVEQKATTMTTTTTSILAPSLSGAEALSSLDVSLSAVSQISSVSLSNDNDEIDLGFGLGSGSKVTADEIPQGTPRGAPQGSPSTIWVTTGQVMSLGPSSAQCPLVGLGPALTQVIVENDLEKEVMITSGNDDCPVVMPPPRFEWRLNGKPISNVPVEARSTPFYTLHGGASPESQGEYTCFVLLSGATPSKSALALGDDLSNIAVSGRRGTLDSSAVEEEIKPAEMILSHVLVQLAKAPEITKSKSAFFDLAEGQPLYLDVNAEASPPPSFQWYLNGVALPGEVRKTLNVGSIKKEHAGAYTCEVSNIAGQVTFMDITVSVRSSPIAEPTGKPGASGGAGSGGGQKLKQPTRKKSTTKKKPLL